MDFDRKLLLARLAVLSGAGMRTSLVRHRIVARYKRELWLLAAGSEKNTAPLVFVSKAACAQSRRFVDLST